MHLAQRATKLRPGLRVVFMSGHIDPRAGHAALPGRIRPPAQAVSPGRARARGAPGARRRVSDQTRRSGTGDGADRGRARRQGGSARRAAAARLCRAAARRRRLRPPRAAGADAAGDRPGARGLPAPDARPQRPVAEPRPLLRHRRQRDAPDPGRAGAGARRDQARRRLGPDDAERRHRGGPRGRGRRRSRSIRRWRGSPSAIRIRRGWSSCATSAA